MNSGGIIDIMDNIMEPNPLLSDIVNCKTAILCIDASGSVRRQFRKNDLQTTFQKILEVAIDLKYDNYRMLFWNSHQNDGGRFHNGAYVIPFVNKISLLPITFDLVYDSITDTCLTEPNLGFNAIPVEWLTDDTMIYLITDGILGLSIMGRGEAEGFKKKFINSITSLSSRVMDKTGVMYKPKISIIAVDPAATNLGSVEVAMSSAGGDMYELIVQNNLTSLISKFTTVHASGQFIQLSRLDADPGYIPYGDKQFLESRIPEFLMYIANQLKADENKLSDAQLRIAQNLSTTLSIMTRDKPANVTNGIIQYVSNFFSLDTEFIKFILTEAIEKERAGKAEVFAKYRSTLHNLYKESANLIQHNVLRATGIKDKFMSFIYNNSVMCGSAGLINSDTIINKLSYGHSAYKGVAVLPLFTNNTLTDSNKQCIRQWVRCWYGDRYQINPLGDEIIYYVLLDVMRIVKSDVNNTIKDSYRQLGIIMLGKKRLNSTSTEYDRLIDGHYPTPNSGRESDFIKLMKSASNKLNIYGSPMRLWGEICISLSPEFAASQVRHYISAMTTSLVFTPIQLDVVDDCYRYDYTCIITLEDLTDVGGWKYLPHVSNSGIVCSPVYLLSSEGKDNLIKSNPMCCVCYTRLNESHFCQMPPRTEYIIPNRYRDRPKFELKANNTQVLVNTLNPDTSYRLVVLHGTYGSGNRSVAQAIMDKVNGRGGYSIIVDIGEYIRIHGTMSVAFDFIVCELRKIQLSTNKDNVLVVDLGDKPYLSSKKTILLGVNFNGWQRIDIWTNFDTNNLSGYYAWTLRNCISNNEATVELHMTKTKDLLFPRDSCVEWGRIANDNTRLNELADQYARWLESNPTDLSAI